MAAVGVDDHQVAGRPVISLAIMDLVPPALDDVEGGLVLVAMAAIAAAGLDHHEVTLDCLGKKRIVLRRGQPLGSRWRRCILMAGGVLVAPRPVVGTDHALGLQAELALSSELVLLALDPAQKDSAGHGLCLLPVPATLTRWGNPRERCVVRPGPVNRARRLDL